MALNHKEGLEIIVKKFDPEFEERWIIFEKILKKNLSENKVWVDVGCGENGNVYEFGKFTKYAFGIDLIRYGNRYDAPLVQGNIDQLPLKSNSVDLVTIRFVIEHIKDTKAFVNEVERVLKSKGIVLILTTNILCPYIFISNVLPFFLKRILIQKIFRANKEDVFPTYHKMNTPGSFKRRIGRLKKTSQVYLQEINYNRKWLFFMLFFWYHITRKIKILERLRASILIVYQKVG